MAVAGDGDNLLIPVHGLADVLSPPITAAVSCIRDIVMRHEEDRISLRGLFFGDCQLLFDPIAHSLGVSVAVAGLIRAGGNKVEAVDNHVAVGVHAHHTLVKLLLGRGCVPVRIEPGIVIAHDVQLIRPAVLIGKTDSNTSL